MKKRLGLIGLVLAGVLVRHDGCFYSASPPPQSQYQNSIEFDSTPIEKQKIIIPQNHIIHIRDFDNDLDPDLCVTNLDLTSAVIYKKEDDGYHRSKSPVTYSDFSKLVQKSNSLE